MTKLSDTQRVILSAAAQRADRNVLPLPGSLRGGAVTKVVGALLSRGFIADPTAPEPVQRVSQTPTGALCPTGQMPTPRHDPTAIGAAPRPSCVRICCS